VKRILTMRVAALVAALAVPGTAGTASAAAAGPPPRRTPQCEAASFFCVTPVLFRGGEGVPLAMAVPLPAVSAPIVAECLDPSDPGQDWTLELIGARPPGARPGRPRPGARRRPAPQQAYLEYTPGGLRSDLCAANVGNRLKLRGCTGSNWQVFIVTPAPAGGGIAPDGWFYLVSDVKAAATGRHLTMTAARVPGAPVVFAAPGSFQDQWWRFANQCPIDRRRPGARAARQVC
jgi:hypothetical protein